MTTPRPKVGDRVRILGHAGLTHGTVVEDAPSHGGCLVLPDGQPFKGGFGYEELAVITAPSPTALERLVRDEDDFG